MCVHIWGNVYVCVWRNCVNVYVSVYEGKCVHLCVCVCVYMCVGACVYVHMWGNVCAWIYESMCVCFCVCIIIEWRERRISEPLSNPLAEEDYNQHGFLSLRLYTFFFRAAPAAYGHSQARGQIRATAASLHYSHSNTGSELRLWRMPQLTALVRSLIHWSKPGIEPTPSWMVSFLLRHNRNSQNYMLNQHLS